MIARRWIGRSALFAALPLLALSLIHAGPRAPLSTPICGPITSDTTWTLAASPYVVTCDTTVNAGVTLTVEPGVVVKLQHTYDDLIVKGRLLATGSEAQPIIFTSYQDDAHGGDTNGDGSATTPAAGDWSCVGIDASSSGSVLDRVWVGYGGYSSSPYYYHASVQFYTSDVTLQHSVIASSWGKGLYVGQVDPGHPLVLTGNTFADNEEWAAYFKAAGPVTDITLVGNTSSGSPYNGFGIQGRLAGAATFSAPSGFPIIADAWEFIIPAGSSLTLAAGTVVKLQKQSASIYVHGQLTTQGTDAEPVVFTSIRDDAHRGDTNGDGSATSPAPGDWSSLMVTGEANLRGAHLLYGGLGGGVGAALRVYNGAMVSFDSGVIENSWDMGIWVSDASRLLVSDSRVEHNLSTALRVDGNDAWVQVTGSSVSENGQGSNPAGGVRNNGKATVVLGGDPALGNSIQANAGYGAYQWGAGGSILATYNWWGDASGPTHPSNPGGLGEEVSNGVVFTPWLTSSQALPGAALVRLFAPLSFSPGDTLNLGVQFSNVLTQTLEDAIVVAHLPEQSEYVLNTGGGLYWPEEHDVVWKLGDVAPGDRLDALVRVRPGWGIPLGTWLGAKALVAATNLPNPAVDLAEVLSYTPVTTLTQHYLTPAEVTAELDADPELDALFEQARALGFAFHDTALRETYSSGTELLTLFLLDRARMDELLFVRRQGDRRSILRTTSAYATEYNDQGGWRYDQESGTWSFWGEWAASLPGAQAGEPSQDPCDPGYRKSVLACQRNALIKFFGYVLDLAHLLQRKLNKVDSCILCQRIGILCDVCERKIARTLQPSWQPFFLILKGHCMTDKHHFDCHADERSCVRSPDGEGWLLRTELCDLLTCDYSGWTDYVPCDTKAACLDGCCQSSEQGAQTCSAGSGMGDGALSALSTQQEEPECTCESDVCSVKQIESLWAHDPNAKLGPAEAAAGEWIPYTVQYENVGAGTAYGVYVEDRLSPLLDEGTLQIEDGGLYFPAARTIYWPVGELAPGAGGSVHFRVQVPADAASGTVIVNSATVYFPSVPEATPTGDVVTLVQDIVAHSQRVETVEGVPLSITLTGHSPVGALTYQIVAAPWGGTLSGTPPDVVYTPAANFEGPDRFTFRVSDGVRQSWPAEVNIVVHTGAETVPPEVWATSPSRDETDVRASEAPVYSDTYAPSISVYFTEPIDPATVTPQTLFVADARGRHLAGYTVYDGGAYAARFVPQERLQQGATYTATVTTGVHDTSGNALAANYVWSFTTEAGPAGRGIYLPLVLRRY